MRAHVLPKRSLFVLLAGAALAGCVATTGTPLVQPNPYPLPPPPRVEVVPKPPVSEELLVWRPGDWEWVGNGYVWQPGEYVKLAGHSNQFLPGQWANEGGFWIWQRGHWL